MFTWLRLREIDLNHLKIRFLDVRSLLIGRILLQGVGECNELPGMDPNSIQPLELFFVAKEGFRYDLSDEKPEGPWLVEIVRNSSDRLHDGVQSCHKVLRRN